MTCFSMRLLSDECEVNIGRTPSRNVREFWGPGAPWLSIADMNQGREINTTKEQITKAGILDANMRLVQKGTVLLSFKLTIGKVSVAKIPLYTNEAIAALPIKNTEKLIPEYLYWCLKTKDLSAGHDRAAMGLTLNKAKLAQVSIPVPKLVDQRRIAAILDQADLLLAKRRKALTLLDSLTHSIFLEMFGDPVTNSMNWERRSLSEVGKIITGNTPSRDVPTYFGSAIEWIKSNNINTPHYYLTKATEGLSESGKAVGRTAPAQAILVTCIAGSPECIGNAAMTDREVAFNQQINAFIPENINPHFAYAHFRVGKRLIQDASTNGMKGMVSKSRFEKIEIMFPPLKLQEIFAARAQVIEIQKSRQQASLMELEALFESIQYRAFAGRL